MLKNVKWAKLLEYIEDNNINFALKRLFSEETLNGSILLENENSAILIDTFKNFIEFFEIEFITLPLSNATNNFLLSIGIDYYCINEAYIIHGYRRAASI